MVKFLRKVIQAIRNKFLHFIGLLSSQKRMTPNFLIIGAQKGGTSSLFYYLKFHPQVKRPIKKEIHYFNIYFEKGINWYLAHFPIKSKKHITGEASPDYIFHPLSAERIKALNPQMKFIVLLRNPINRAYSAYQMNKRMGIDPRETFEEAVNFELNLSNDSYNEYDYNKHNFFYLARGKYSSQLKYFENQFSKNQIHIISSESFFRNTEMELKKVYKFLSIKEITLNSLRPMNVGEYPPISSHLYENLKQYFNADLTELKENWDIEIDI